MTDEKMKTTTFMDDYELTIEGTSGRYRWRKKEMDGYATATKIEEQIVEILKKYPMQDHPMAWWHFTRTLTSALRIMESEAISFLFKERYQQGMREGM